MMASSTKLLSITVHEINDWDPNHAQEDFTQREETWMDRDHGC
jgi:hypothetical protein